MVRTGCAVPSDVSTCGAGPVRVSATATPGRGAGGNHAADDRPDPPLLVSRLVLGPRRRARHQLAAAASSLRVLHRRYRRHHRRRHRRPRALVLGVELLLQLRDRLLHHVAVGGVVGRVVQVRTILAHRLALVPELPLTLRDVEQERRILDVAIGLAERVERLLELAEVVVLAAGAKRCARARAIICSRGVGAHDDDGEREDETSNCVHSDDLLRIAV